MAKKDIAEWKNIEISNSQSTNQKRVWAQPISEKMNDDIDLSLGWFYIFVDSDTLVRKIDFQKYKMSKTKKVRIKMN